MSGRGRAVGQLERRLKTDSELEHADKETVS